MGPRLQERGVQSGQTRMNRHEKSFNGAALTRARSFAPESISTTRRLLLQWGRAYKSAELDTSLGRETLRRQLQWGRAYKSAEFPKRAANAASAAIASMGPRLQERGV